MSYVRFAAVAITVSALLAWPIVASRSQSIGEARASTTNAAFAQTSATVAPEPSLQSVAGDTWLTTNAKYNGSWAYEDPARPSFALWMNDRGGIPYERGLGGAGFWVHRSGCVGPFGAFAQQCGWNLALVATQEKSVIVGGNTIEIDGNGSLPYGRILNASDGRAHYVGIASNVFGDFSGTDKPDQSSWLSAINVSEDTFEIRRRDRQAKSRFETLFAIEPTGDVNVAGAVASARFEQRSANQWATRTRLRDGRSTFVFPRPFQEIPVCVASSEDGGSGELQARPSRASCVVVGRIRSSSIVDIVVIGNPK